MFDKKENVSPETKELTKSGLKRPDIPSKRIDGINMPYVEIEMTNGTLCDLNGEPRSIKVLYVCYQHGSHEIYSLKEISSCKYEAIILSPLLCSHPSYKPQDNKKNDMNCRPVDDSLTKPKSLLALEAESIRLRLKNMVIQIAKTD